MQKGYLDVAVDLYPAPEGSGFYAHIDKGNRNNRTAQIVIVLCKDLIASYSLTILRNPMLTTARIMLLINMKEGVKIGARSGKGWDFPLTLLIIYYYKVFNIIRYLIILNAFLLGS